MKRRSVTIVFHVDGRLDSTKYRLPLWAFEAGKWGALVIGLSVVLFFTLVSTVRVDVGVPPGRLRMERVSVVPVNCQRT